MLLAAIQKFDGLPRSRCHCLGNFRDVCAFDPERLTSTDQALGALVIWFLDMKPALPVEHASSLLLGNTVFADVVGINGYQDRRVAPEWFVMGLIAHLTSALDWVEQRDTR